MARKRMLTPDIWTDEAFVSLSHSARLLFIGCISQADDAGRLKATPSTLRLAIFPGDRRVTNQKVEEWRADVCKSGLARLYVVEGKEYLDLPSWKKHQKIDHPTDSDLPPWTLERSVSPHRALPEPSPSPLSGNPPRVLGESSRQLVNQLGSEVIKEKGLDPRPSPSVNSKRRRPTKRELTAGWRDISLIVARESAARDAQLARESIANLAGVVKSVPSVTPSEVRAEAGRTYGRYLTREERQ